jgi:hypothetical protein
MYCCPSFTVRRKTFETMVGKKVGDLGSGMTNFLFFASDPT